MLQVIAPNSFGMGFYGLPLDLIEQKTGFFGKHTKLSYLTVKHLGNEYSEDLFVYQSSALKVLFSSVLINN